MSVSFLKVRSDYDELKQQLDDAYRRVLDSGRYILGPELAAFEQEFADFCEAEHCIGVANGLEALELILRAVGIRPGDEVLVPGNTFIATWLAVSKTGATPVPVEPLELTYNLDPHAMEAKITRSTRAIIVVHLYGQPGDVDAVLTIARRHGLYVFEDAAQAHGAWYKGRRVGGLADAAGFSFYPGKNLGAFGDGGAVVTQDERIATRIRKLRNYGGVTRGQHDELATNSRLDELQAAFLRAKLRVLDSWNRHRQAVASMYLEALSKIPELNVPSVLRGVEPVWHLFVVRHERRDWLAQRLNEKGIETSIHYPTPPHQSAAYRNRLGFIQLPVCERLAKTVLSLPMGPHLAREQVGDVINALHEVLAA